jgi:dienelactone hydrolase
VIARPPLRGWLLRWIALALLGFGVCAIAAPAPVRTMQVVTFASVDRDAAGRNLPLNGFLLLPRTPAPSGGYPAVIALHGCGGLHSTRKGHEQELAERLALRAELFLADGFAVLFPDSFGARDVREVCTIRIGERTVTAGRRRLDALGALAYLARRKDIRGNRIAVVGWSHGGSAVLQAINVRDPEVAAFESSPNAPAFRAAVAFYPGCNGPLKAGERWQPGVPTRIHIGELDDWTPATPCVELARVITARGADFDVTTYAGSYHAFDAPTGRVMRRLDVPNGVHPGEGVTVGPNPAARATANVRVRAFLRDRLAP